MKNFFKKNHMKKTGDFLFNNYLENNLNQVNTTTDIAGIGNNLLESQLGPGWSSVLSSPNAPTPQRR